MLDIFYNLSTGQFVMVMFILFVFSFIYTETENNCIAKKTYNKTKYMLPISITYHGKTLFIEEKMEIFQNSFFNTCWFDTNAAQMITYFINGHPVACIAILKPKLIKHYYLDYNGEYDTSDFESIMKEVANEYKKQLKKSREKLYENNRRTKIYELVSQEQKDE